MGITPMSIVWTLVFLAAIVFESITAELVAIWFVPGAITALVLSAFSVEVWIQCVVFLVISAVLMILAFKIFRKIIFRTRKENRTDTDLIIGSSVKVLEKIDNLEMTGAVKVGGQIWSARMANDEDTAEIGEFVFVERISGVKLICIKKPLESK